MIALYIHCTIHQLNICVTKACSIQIVRNMTGTVTELSNFFKCYPKRPTVLQSMIVEMYRESNVVKLTDVCAKRWIERPDSAYTVFTVMGPLVLTPAEMRREKSFHTETVTQACGFHHQTTQSDFLTAMVVCTQSLSYTRELTIKLQGNRQSCLKHTLM